MARRMITGSIWAGGIINTFHYPMMEQVQKEIMDNSVVNYFGVHPVVGCIVSVTHIIAGGIMQVQQANYSAPAWLLSWLSAGAYIMGMAAAAFTIYGVIRTHHGKKSNKKK